MVGEEEGGIGLQLREEQVERQQRLDRATPGGAVPPDPLRRDLPRDLGQSRGPDACGQGA